eukprot:Hpha_TRINITY_DN16033_c0_g1::TRINITY_DN16033_c0_g1_i2::g.121663::m.121663
MRQRSERAGFPEGPPADQYILPGGVEGSWREPLDNVQSYVTSFGPTVNDVTNAPAIMGHLGSDAQRAFSSGDRAHSIDRLFDAYHKAVVRGELSRFTPEVQEGIHRRVAGAADTYNDVLGRSSAAAEGWHQGYRAAELRTEPVLRRPTGASAADIAEVTGAWVGAPLQAVSAFTSTQQSTLNKGITDGSGSVKLQVLHKRFDVASDAWRHAGEAVHASNYRLSGAASHGAEESGQAAQKVYSEAARTLSAHARSAKMHAGYQDWDGVMEDVTNAGGAFASGQIPVLPGQTRQMMHATVCMSGHLGGTWEL